MTLLCSAFKHYGFVLSFGCLSIFHAHMAVSALPSLSNNLFLSFSSLPHLPTYLHILLNHNNPMQFS